MPEFFCEAVQKRTEETHDNFQARRPLREFRIRAKFATNNSDANAGSGKIFRNAGKNTFARDNQYAPLLNTRNKGTTNEVQQTCYPYYKFFNPALTLLDTFSKT